jgi:hypothetical protein
LSQAALGVGLVGDVKEKPRICLFNAITIKPPPSDLPFFFVLLVRTGADFDFLLPDCIEALGNYGDSEVDVRVKLVDVMASLEDSSTSFRPR